MPYDSEHKQQTRLRIIRSAHRLFNRRGFTDVSIDEIMSGAGLTRGGFYAHFENKEQLYAEAITLILKEHPAGRWEGIDINLSSENIAQVIVNAYLSRQHFDDIEGSCPMIALPTDIARGSETMQSAFRQVLESMINIFKTNLPDNSDDYTTALSIACLCVGGMVLARAVGDANLADEIRDSARQLALKTGGWQETATLN